ncbi:2-(5''-triphosphoribosyl)-3'-dephosphocoenzyme-A synthase [Candidatus Izimaplasma bacterium HR1]|jgi:holo-ACP synthase CitX|uniref:citrate lyase holo-[acyl-carrier protein] synthase n=1 Tax=Candidatus Izimoplasma sp. HR1 TaxID=1541959 RepID=UPI0004F6131D|nr:2-(5''-triphosphoribosyl)-3'-dephosphocoenzyme-A synthase [Candidatus Izimaplasma bacterium HR1]
MNEILQAREVRAKHIEDLMIEYPNKTVIILKTNVVGEDKNPLHLKFMCAFFNDIIFDTFKDKILVNGHQFSEDGNYCFFVVDEIGAMVKIRTIEIEEATPLGRLIDIDVYHKKSITRQDLSCEMRKCLICDNYAHLCARQQKHPQIEIHNKMEEIIHNFLKEYVTNITIKAIYSELELYPKFGLVSHIDSGCHNDMDYETFIKSTFAIKKYLIEYVEVGLEKEFDPLRLQKIGLRAEKRMYKATKGVNTHKGLIFLLGIFLPALTKTIILNESKAYLKEQIKDITKTIVGDYYSNLESKEELSNADKIFMETGLKGIRGEALEGLELIFTIPEYKDYDMNITHHNYLIHLMSELNDTTIIHKTNQKTLDEVQHSMKEIINNNGYESNKELVHKISDEYQTKCISPGGSADMLVVKIIYEDLKKLIK